jgi:putative ABC transport system permease protein
MKFFAAAQLAWSNSTVDLRRLLVRCAGIAFAVVLMFMQTGFQNALFDSNLRLVEKIDADFVIRTKTRYMLSSGQPMSLRDVVSARACLDVVDAEAVYIENVASSLRKYQGPKRRIRVIGMDVRSGMFQDFQIFGNGSRPIVEQLDDVGAAAADLKSKPMFGFNQRQALSGQPFGELAGKTIKLVGYFELGIDFSNDGNLIMTPENFAHFFPHRGGGNPRTQVDYGFIKCRTGFDSKAVLADLKRTLGPHVLIDSKRDFLKSERRYWGKTTPIGLIFMVGTIIGFVVGLIICYQVLATDIGDHLSEFATIKAMGYPPIFFAAVVVIQALLLSLFSFGPGLLISISTFSLINQFTGLVMHLNLARVSLILALTVAMCVCSGIFALRKLLLADPANLF